MNVIKNNEHENVENQTMISSDCRDICEWYFKTFWNLKFSIFHPMKGQVEYPILSLEEWTFLDSSPKGVNIQRHIQKKIHFKYQCKNENLKLLLLLKIIFTPVYHQTFLWMRYKDRNVLMNRIQLLKTFSWLRRILYK